MADNDVEFTDEIDGEIDATETAHFSEAVLYASDWTVETMVSQLTRGNIELNPRFQRRDAWTIRRKSAFIESLILNLPVPQIVLAEKRGQRGKYLVLDGKQRLLSLLQFTGNAQDGPANAFRLSGLAARSDLTRLTFETLRRPGHESDLNAFLNYTIRTVVIRNWPNYDFLHLVFLRLNTGSVKLSPQELRQAMFPGEFSNMVDDSASASAPLRSVLGRENPDPRMRDVELLVRFLAFHFFLPEYVGRMKDFLDMTCERFNAEWDGRQEQIAAAVGSFNDAIALLAEMFGADGIARRANSRSFNRAIFDALVFYAANDAIRAAMSASREAVMVAYALTIENPEFIRAVESDTAGVPNTLARLRIWGENLQNAIGLQFQLPEARAAMPGAQIGRAGILFEGLGV